MLPRPIILFSVSLLMCSLALGQDLCVQNLEQAQRNFNEGRFYSIEPLLSGCISSGFNKQERIQAMELLALTKLYLDDLDEADSIYLNLLRIDPERQVNELLDPPDLIFLHNSFRTDALFLWSLIAGGNITRPWIVHDYSNFPENEINEKYSNNGGLEIGAGLEINIKRKFYIGIEAILSRKSFIYTDDVLDNKYRIRYVDISEWINVPAYVKHYFGSGKWTYYGYAGLQFDYLLANRQNDLQKNPTLINPESSVSSYSVTDRRERINYSVAFGGGIRYKTNGISLIVFDVKINPGLTNPVNESKRYEDQMTGIFYGNVDDVYRINSISFTARFMQPFYQPKKLKQFSR